MSKKPDKAASRGTSEEHKGEGWKSNVVTIGGALLLALFIRVTLFEAFAIDGPSMEPSLLDGDRVVVAKYPYGLFLPFTHEAIINWGGPSPGDIIILHSA
jgi:signal peptidase I